MTARSRSPAPVPCPRTVPGRPGSRPQGERGFPRRALRRGPLRCPARHAAGRAPLGGPHAGHRTRVDVGAGHMARGGEAGAYGLHEGVADTVHGARGVGGGGGDGERGDRFVPRDLPCARAQDQRMPRGHAPHALVGRRVMQRLGDVRGGEQRREVADVEVGLDEVGQRQRGRGVGRTARPGGVEDGARGREVTGDHDAAADLDDRRVTAGPGGQVAQRAAARGEEAHPQLFVGGPAGAEDGDAGPRVDRHGPHLVGAPVADRPERVGVAPQELGAHGLHGLAVVSGGPGRAHRRGRRGGTAPPHQPPHRCLHRLWTDRRRGAERHGRPVHRRTGVPCCHEGGAREGPRGRSRGGESARARRSIRPEGRWIDPGRQWINPGRAVVEGRRTPLSLHVPNSTLRARAAPSPALCP